MLADIEFDYKGNIRRNISKYRDFEEKESWL
jgi:hypothetical protein